MKLSDLSAPFPADAISWRAQQVTQAGDKALALAYIDARDVMRRLDATVGPENWSDAYVETVKGRVICTLSICIEGEWISKSDGAGDTDVEGEKGGMSDAFKRAAVKWGIGRYLYEVGATFAPCDIRQANGKKYWKAWKPEAHRMFNAALDKAAKATHTAAAVPVQSAPAELPTGPINDKTRDWVSDQLHKKQIEPGELCRAFEVTSLKALTYEQINAVKDWLTNYRKAA